MSSLKCHRCDKICKSKSGLTNHLKLCMSKIKKEPKQEKKQVQKKGKESCFGCKKEYPDNGWTYCDPCKLSSVLNKTRLLFDLRTG